jgi:CHRD domain
MRISRAVTMFAVVALVGVACEDTVTGIPAGLEVYTATLNGANERPDATTTPATGRATVTVLEDTLVSWQVSVMNITNVSIGHIHYGPADSAGGVRIDLTPTPGNYTTETLIALGSAGISAQNLADLRAGKMYVNIHTTDGVGGTDPVGPAGDYPGGEIRGQLIKQ